MSNGSDANCHSQILSAAGGTTAASTTNLGNITLPAGGPWTIHAIHGLVVNATSTAAEGIIGHLRMTSVSGDVSPNPAPSRWPVSGASSFLGAATGRPFMPTTLWPTKLEAAGKAIITLDWINDTVATVAPRVLAGIMYSRTIPEPMRAPFSDRVGVACTAAGATAIGTITLAEKATRITAVGCELLQSAVSTAAEELLGWFVLSSDDIDFAPSQWPCSGGFSAGLATNHGLGDGTYPLMIPVDIPVLGGARVDCTINLVTAVTNAARASVTIMYE
jgi:hypothetical protein